MVGEGSRQIGDLVQFSRFAIQLKQRGASYVILRAPQMAHALLRGISAIDELIDTNDPIPNFDYHAPLLPMIGFFADDNAKLFSSEKTLVVNPDLLQRWDYILQSQTLPRIGINWTASSDGHQMRSIPWDLFKSLHTYQYDFISLRRDCEEGHFWLRQFPNHSVDLLDCAALCALCDLVITVDTATLHIAAAQGVKTLALIPAQADWRWGTTGSTSHWYPTLTLYRQVKPNDWSYPLEKIKRFLATWRVTL